jgi:hypothetical protein
MLQRFCIGQENGGRIVGCAAWKDRKWQQLARVTLAEVKRESELWVWDGPDLVVWGYPVEKETEVRTKREVARTNGKGGGRPPKNPPEAPPQTVVGLEDKPTLVNSEKAEGKGREGEGKGREIPLTPLGGDEIFPVGVCGVDAVDIAAMYPKRERMAEAVTEIARQIKAGADPAAMVAGTKACAAVMAAAPGRHLNSYFPSAYKFFRDRRWEDDPQAFGRVGNGPNGAPKETLDLGGRRAAQTINLTAKKYQKA